ncbi:MAG: hypothetical protein IJE50_03255 [Clostridia bacterium]|nr:hypothetical protein [Clostridia bacterium]
MNLLMLLANSFADSSFAKLFMDMNPWCIGLFVLGIIFLIIEVFIPGFGFFGISGTVMIVIGMIVRLANGGDGWMLLYMVLIFLAILIVLFVIASKVIKKGSKVKNSIFHSGIAVSEDKSEGTKDYSAFLNKVATTQTVLRPIGKATCDGVVLDVVARDGFIEKGKQVQIIAVEGQKIEVIEIQED